MAASLRRASPLLSEPRSIREAPISSSAMRAFTPSSEELAQARRVVEAMETAEANGQGAVTLDGKMIDYANVRMARRIIELGS